jgi:DNA-binding PadR family transcriptional regulator
LHGYGIIKEVARNSDGHYRLGPGTLYDNLKKLMDAGLVADAATSSSSKRKPVSLKEDDRRFYTLTKDGKNALAAEVDRLQSVVREAKLRLQEARTGKA